MIEFHLILTITFFILFLISTYYAVKFGLVILKLEDIIEESMDMLDDSYSSLSKIAEKPVFFDSVEVRQCISEINNSRFAILRIANALASIDNNLNEEHTIEQHNKGEEKSSQKILFEKKEEE